MLHSYMDTEMPRFGKNGRITRDLCHHAEDPEVQSFGKFLDRPRLGNLIC